jgi:hypothetical protein
MHVYLANGDLRPRGLEVHLIIHAVKAGALVAATRV